MTNNYTSGSLFFPEQEELRNRVKSIFLNDEQRVPEYGHCVSIFYMPPSGSVKCVNITKRRDRSYTVCAKDSEAQDIATFSEHSRIESKALNLYCCLPIEITEDGFSITCTHKNLERVVPLFILFLQTLSASRKLRNLKRMNG